MLFTCPLRNQTGLDTLTPLILIKRRQGEDYLDQAADISVFRTLEDEKEDRADFIRGRTPTGSGSDEDVERMKRGHTVCLSLFFCCSSKLESVLSLLPLLPSGYINYDFISQLCWAAVSEFLVNYVAIHSFVQLCEPIDGSSCMHYEVWLVGEMAQEHVSNVCRCSLILNLQIYIMLSTSSAMVVLNCTLLAS